MQLIIGLPTPPWISEHVSVVVHLKIGYENVLHPNKGETDKAYDGVIADVIARISEKDAQDTYVIIATHNQNSVQKATDAMQQAGLPANDPHIHFAQVEFSPFCAFSLSFEFNR